MPLKYNPRDLKDNSFKPGKYEAQVRSAQEVEYKSSPGLKVVLDVFVDGQVFTAFEDCSYSPGGLKFLERFLTAVGEDFNNPPDAHELVNKPLVAQFKANAKGYPEVDYYFDPPAKLTARVAKPVATEEEMPF